MSPPCPHLGQLHSTICLRLPNKEDPEGPARVERSDMSKPACNMGEVAPACSSPGIMALEGGSQVLIAEG